MTKRQLTAIANRTKWQKYDRDFILARIDIDPQTGCWLWNKGIASAGYGVVNTNGHTTAHRLAYSIWIGDPGGLNVCHSCDNPPCCNPAHLFAGTQNDNIQDATNKGRFPQGELHWKSKLTAETVNFIRGSKESGKSLAFRYGVSESTVSVIRNRKSWSRQ